MRISGKFFGTFLLKKDKSMKRILVLTCAVVCFAAGVFGQQQQQRKTIAALTEKAQRIDGFVPLYVNSEEGKIFLEHQAWPVIGDLTTRERGLASMDAVHELLASPYGNHLNWPSFTHVDDTVGFLTRVYPGIKENGAIFSHPNA